MNWCRNNETRASNTRAGAGLFNHLLGVRHGGIHMTQAEISGIAPFFIVRHVPSSLAFYRDRLGFEITFQGPSP
jgi:hypothetical protein